MGLLNLEVYYYCSDDCRQEGCPGHKATLAYHSVTDMYSFDINGQKFYLELGALGAMLYLLNLSDNSLSVDMGLMKAISDDIKNKIDKEHK